MSGYDVLKTIIAGAALYATAMIALFGLTLTLATIDVTTGDNP
jgi:hypothetical protein